MQARPSGPQDDAALGGVSGHVELGLPPRPPFPATPPLPPGAAPPLPELAPASPPLALPPSPPAPPDLPPVAPLPPVPLPPVPLPPLELPAMLPPVAPPALPPPPAGAPPEPSPSSEDSDEQATRTKNAALTKVRVISSSLASGGAAESQTPIAPVAFVAFAAGKTAVALCGGEARALSHFEAEIALRWHKGSMAEKRRVLRERAFSAPAQDKLFHVLVVLGSALITGGACGQSISRDRDRGGGNTGGTGAGSAGIGGTSTGGVLATGGIGAVSATGGTAGGAMAGRAGSGGVPPQCEVGQGGEMSASGAPNSPDDCANEAQFQCAEYEPEPRDCACDPVAPPAAECCPPDTRFFCAGGYDPPIGCRCEIMIITR